MIKIDTNFAPKAIGPYSQAVFVGNTLYSSGQIALDPLTMLLVGGGIESQTEQVCLNLGEVLKEAGLGYEDVVKTTIFLDNIDNFSKVNEIYGRFFSHKPARSTVEVSKLPLGALVEIEIVAIKP
ncbi:reactive intermediate/imine deaminase [Candidatus Gracilibacteria bacterium]|nr:MAG: reactive intermediate/imine deaminase [Candidatus Gracilibacteria bacterium]PIE85772.1 MAG: reactive intermediate/imine deaminase [Candidatus Gracilibacteria bacterium]